MRPGLIWSGWYRLVFSLLFAVAFFVFFGQICSEEFGLVGRNDSKRNVLFHTVHDPADTVFAEVEVTVVEVGTLPA